MNSITQRVLAGLLLTTLFAACSRPVTYFQKSPRQQFVTASATPTSAFDVIVAAEKVVAAPATVLPDPQVAQANTAMNQLEAVVRNGGTLSADKTVEKRLNRMRALLTSATAKSNLASSNAVATKKMNLMERMVMKKMNRKINNKLAPANPDKPMANTAILSAGAVVVIIGLVILLVGGSSTAGTILLLAGAVILLVGLL